MKKICAWCGAVLDPGDGSDNRVSHGICPACVDKHFPKPVEDTQKIVDANERLVKEMKDGKD